MLRKLNILFVVLTIAALALFTTSNRSLFAAENASSHSISHDDHDESEHESHIEQEYASEDEHEDEDHDHAEDEQNAHEHDHDQVIELDHETEQMMALNTIKAQKGSVETMIRLTGKIRLNEDNVAHVVPYASGIVRQVSKKLGDPVRAGEKMALIHSRQLSEAKAEYLASVQRHVLSKSVYEREKNLWQQKISSEQEFIQAKIDFAEAEINVTLAEQKLYVFGLDQTSISNLDNEPHNLFMEYTITAPFDGVVIDKHITRGEVVKSDSPVFTIADLNTVWIDFDVFPKDLQHVKTGQTLTVLAGSRYIETHLMYVSPVLNPETRTATARVILDNSKGTLYPGQFVTALLSGKTYSGTIVIPQKAVQVINGEKCVFVKNGTEYELREVALGRSNKEWVEIISGVKENENVVTDGAFELKSKIVTSTLDSHAGHGH